MIHNICDTDSMAKRVEKSDLPSKDCAACGRPFTWREKWEKVWDDMKYCSDKCRAKKNESRLVMEDGFLVFSGGGKTDIDIVEFINSEREKRSIAQAGPWE